jgi:hypothetical protein
MWTVAQGGRDLRCVFRPVRSLLVVGGQPIYAYLMLHPTHPPTFSLTL